MCHELHARRGFCDRWGVAARIALVKLYLAALGRQHTTLCWVVARALLVVNKLSNTFQIWFLGYWPTHYEDHPAAISEHLLVSVTHSLGQYFVSS